MSSIQFLFQATCFNSSIFLFLGTRLFGMPPIPDIGSGSLFGKPANVNPGTLFGSTKPAQDLFKSETNPFSSSSNAQQNTFKLATPAARFISRKFLLHFFFAISKMRL